jgi:hypothetical protein
VTVGSLVFAPITESYADRVRALAGKSMSDPQIGRELGLTKKQVERVRRANGIEAGGKPGGQPGSRWSDDDPPLCDRRRSVADPDSAQGRWVAMLEAASGSEWMVMRDVVRDVLRVGDRVGDVGLIVAAQRDPRTAEELAGSYLLRYLARRSR